MNDAYIYQISDLRKAYHHPVGELEVLKGVSLLVRHGESVAVTGPSGVGKTTLLHVLGLLDEPTSGTILLDGVNVRDLGEKEKAKNKEPANWFCVPILSVASGIFCS